MAFAKVSLIARKSNFYSYLRTFANQSFTSYFANEASGDNLRPTATATAATADTSFTGQNIGNFPRHQMTMPANIRQQYIQRTTAIGDSSPAGELFEVPNNRARCLGIIKPAVKRMIRRNLKQNDEPPMRADAIYGEKLYTKKDYTENNYNQTWSDYPQGSAIKSSAIGPTNFNIAGRRPTNKY